MVYTGRESIKLGPPLTISKDAIKVATKIIKKNILKFLMIKIRHTGLVTFDLKKSLSFWKQSIKI